MTYSMNPLWLNMPQELQGSTEAKSLTDMLADGVMRGAKKAKKKLHKVCKKEGSDATVLVHSAQMRCKSCL